MERNCRVEWDVIDVKNVFTEWLDEKGALVGNSVVEDGFCSLVHAAGDDSKGEKMG